MIRPRAAWGIRTLTCQVVSPGLHPVASRPSLVHASSCSLWPFSDPTAPAAGLLHGMARVLALVPTSPRGAAGRRDRPGRAPHRPGGSPAPGGLLRGAGLRCATYRPAGPAGTAAAGPAGRLARRVRRPGPDRRPAPLERPVADRRAHLAAGGSRARHHAGDPRAQSGRRAGQPRCTPHPHPDTHAGAYGDGGHRHGRQSPSC